MKSVMIACKTIEQELLAAMRQTGCSWPVLWLESGLHNWPDKLRAQIQQLLDSCGGYDTVLLAMSFCGNSVVGLRTGDFRLVVPRCDDCITLLLGSRERRQEIPATYFLTEGWLKGERNLWAEYKICIRKYGEKRGKRIFTTMLANYRHLALLDTGCFDRQALENRVQSIARALELEYLLVDGSLEYLKALLAGEWNPERFLLVPPNTAVTSEMCAVRPQQLQNQQAVTL